MKLTQGIDYAIEWSIDGNAMTGIYQFHSAIKLAKGSYLIQWMRTKDNTLTGFVSNLLCKIRTVKLLDSIDTTK